MKYNKKTIFFCITAFVLCYCGGCKTSFPNGKELKKEKKGWVKVLKTADVAVKNYWIDLVDGDFESLNNHQVFLKEVDVPKLVLRPLLVYSLDSIGILSMTNKSSLSKILVLDKTKAIYYGVIKDTIKVMIYPQYIADSFTNGQGYTGVFPLLEKKLASLSNNNIEFYHLNVIAFPSTKRRIMSYLFYVNKNGEFLSLQPDGKEISLQELLLALKQRVFQIKIKEI